MHVDEMGTMTVIGIVKDGSKLVTAVEACDSVLALKLVNFRLYAKPGGSSFLLNPPVDRVIIEDVPDSAKELWTRHGIRWGTFNISKGDGYVIPAGIPHEFLNRQKSLSIAWNVLPRCHDCVGTPPSTAPHTLPRYLHDHRRCSSPFQSTTCKNPYVLFLLPRLPDTRTPPFLCHPLRPHSPLHYLSLFQGERRAAVDFTTGIPQAVCHKTKLKFVCLGTLDLKFIGLHGLEDM